MLRHNRKPPLPRRGAACVELAILLPFLIFCFLLGIDWCRIFYVGHTLDDCARSAALAASGIAYQERGMTTDTRAARGKAEAVKGGTTLSPPLAASNVVVTTAGDYVTVAVSYDFHAVSMFPGLGGTHQVTRTVRLPILPGAITTP
jgi:Flp pilus assembly protein TadG